MDNAAELVEAEREIDILTAALVHIIKHPHLAADIAKAALGAVYDEEVDVNYVPDGTGRVVKIKKKIPIWEL